MSKWNDDIQHLEQIGQWTNTANKVGLVKSLWNGSGLYSEPPVHLVDFHLIG